MEVLLAIWNLIVTISISVLLIILYVKFSRNKTISIEEPLKYRIEKEIFDDNLIYGHVRYLTKVKCSLVDMNVCDSVINDIERDKYNDIIMFSEMNRLTPEDCAIFILNDYITNKQINK